MKTSPAFFAFLLVALAVPSAVSLCTAAETKPALAHPVKSVERTNSATIVRGTSAIEVLRALGAPARKLSADIWAYPRFNAGYEQSRDDNCSILLVTFRDSLVVDLQLVNERAERVFAARLQSPPPANVLIAAQGKVTPGSTPR